MKLSFSLRLSQRLALSYGFVLILLLGISSISLQRLSDLTEILDHTAVRGSERGQAVMSMERASNQFMTILHDMPASDLGNADAMLKKATESWQDSMRAERNAKLLLPDDEDAKRLFEEAVAAGQAVYEVIEVGRKNSGDRGDSAIFFNIRQQLTSDAALWRSRQHAWTNAVVKLADWEIAQRRTTSEGAMKSAQSARIFVLGGAFIALSICTVTGLLVTRDISRRIAEAVRFTQRVAKHDLSTSIAVSRKDELGDLAAALEEMRTALHSLAIGVRDTSSDIANASTEIAQGSIDLSSRTEQAAITLQAANNSISDLTYSVDQTVQSSNAANHLAFEAKTTATQGGEVVNQAVITMDEIENASRKIVDITAIINGIAFQTNILALNAAVEAARAGEQGRGFAVVAGEVRTLAQRCANAAREIDALIEASLQKVISGSAQVRLAGGTTENIMISVQRVSGIVSTITDEANQQRQVISRVHESVQELDLVAQQNAALAEESAAAAASLQQQAVKLTQMVASFKLEIQERSYS